MAIVNFDTYVVSYGTRNLPNGTPTAFIDCYQQNTQVGQLQFYPAGSTFTSGGGYSGSILILYFTIEQFRDILTILRQGVVLYFDPTAQYGWMISAQEPLSALELQPKPLIISESPQP